MKLRFVGYAALAVFCAGAIGYAQTTSTTGAPSITPGGIANATGYQTTLAPGVVFVIFGNNLGPATIQGASLPYPQNLVGTSISFTPAAGGAAIPANLIYTSAAVVAGFLPSSATPGTYSVRVTYNLQTSPPQNVTVAQRSFGIGTSNSGGTGEAQATLANVNNGLSLIRFTTGSVNSDGYNFELTPAHPGDTVVLWGTGGGADPANDAGGTSGDQTAAGNFMVTVDGTQITPLYAGAVTGYPGLWQINFVLPTSMPADCFASVQVTAGGQTGNSATLAIAAPGQTSCSSQINTTTFDSLENGGNITFAGLTIAGVVYYSGGTVQNSTIAGGVFNQYTAAAFLIDYSGAKIGGCTVVQETTPTGGKEPSGPNALLDAGTLTLSGPGVPSQTMPVTVGPLGPAYSASLAAGALENGGTYTLTGSGGKQSGAVHRDRYDAGQFHVQLEHAFQRQPRPAADHHLERVRIRSGPDPDYRRHDDLQRDVEHDGVVRGAGGSGNLRHSRSGAGRVAVGRDLADRDHRRALPRRSRQRGIRHVDCADATAGRRRPGRFRGVHPRDPARSDGDGSLIGRSARERRGIPPPK